MRDRAAKEQAIRDIRAGKRKQVDVAAEFGVTRQAVSAWMKGSKRQHRFSRDEIGEIIHAVRTQSPLEAGVGESGSEWSWPEVEALSRRVAGAPPSAALRERLASHVEPGDRSRADAANAPSSPDARADEESPLVIDAPVEPGSKAAVDHLRRVLLGQGPLPEPEAERSATPPPRGKGPGRATRLKARAERKKKRKTRGKRKR